MTCMTFMPSCFEILRISTKFGLNDSTTALVLTFERSPMFEMIVAFMVAYEEVNIFKGIDMRGFACKVDSAN